MISICFIAGLIRLQEILKYANPEDKWLVRRLEPGEDNRPLLKTLKATGETRVILDCPTNRIMDYLRQANEVKFFEDYMVILYPKTLPTLCYLKSFSFKIKGKSFIIHFRAMF